MSHTLPDCVAVEERPAAKAPRQNQTPFDASPSVVDEQVLDPAPEVKADYARLGRLADAFHAAKAAADA